MLWRARLGLVDFTRVPGQPSRLTLSNPSSRSRKIREPSGIPTFGSFAVSELEWPQSRPASRAISGILASGKRTEDGTLCDQEPFLFLVKKQESPLKLMRCSFKLRCGVALGKGVEWLAASHKRHRTGVASVAVRAVEVIQLAAGTFLPLHPCSIVFSWWLLTFVGPCLYADVYSFGQV